MPVQRKVFRIEQMTAISAAAAGALSGAVSARHQQEILAELKALQDLIERRAGSAREMESGEVALRGLQALKDETDSIHHAISRTKHEIATLHVSAFNGVGDTQVTRELDAVVEGAERATLQIIDAAETIEEAADTLSASLRQQQQRALAQDIQDHVVRIFEACNFQDLSGQRIGKVLATLKFVEDRVARMMEIWGGTEAFKPYTAAALAEHTDEGELMHGPKLDGASGHASQDEIDALFAVG
ncbi:MAG: chemotaxis protein CheZ [Alphaproteobacteria bacterium]|jgi:chemotaxis protein CheZ|nr:chemotaxis protein CheZ [Alphaproteobacteria bacterium]